MGLGNVQYQRKLSRACADFSRGPIQSHECMQGGVPSENGLASETAEHSTVMPLIRYSTIMTIFTVVHIREVKSHTYSRLSVSVVSGRGDLIIGEERRSEHKKREAETGGRLFIRISHTWCMTLNHHGFDKRRTGSLPPSIVHRSANGCCRLHGT